VKLIAEPWDLGNGGYQVGNFPVLWTEWNGRFRDCVRGFWMGKGVTLGDLATRITGSSDLYAAETGRNAVSSINFVTCHDGFNLLDLVSYNEKHNEENGENNCDGANDNNSYNHGVEGPTDDEVINEIRWRQRANLLATLFLSLGVPMLLGGDELSLSQQGNNNTYCQDNEMTWFNWDLDSDGDDFLEFTQKLIKLRQSHPVFRRRRHLRGASQSGVKDITWYFSEGREPQPHEWNDKGRQSLGWIMDGNAIEELSATGTKITGETLLVLLNAHFNDIKFKLPPHPSGKVWQLTLSTDRQLSPKYGTIFNPGEEFHMQDHTVSIFLLYSQRVRKMSKYNIRRFSMPNNTINPDAKLCAP